MNLIHRFNLAARYREWLYKKYSKNAIRHDYDPELLVRDGYSSQCGQDKWLVENMFNRLGKGIFVDIGAHDGVSFSNTLFLEKQLNWSGLAVEPMPEIFERLDRNRTCIKVQGCIAAIPGKARFQKITGYSEMLSGLVGNYDSRHKQRIGNELNLHGGQAEEIEVDCFRLNDLLEKNKIEKVHYLNIDVEGAEYDILKSINFDNVEIVVCGVENNYNDYRIPRLMEANGFELVAIVGDEFYVNRKAWKN